MLDAILLFRPAKRLIARRIYPEEMPLLIFSLRFPHGFRIRTDGHHFLISRRRGVAIFHSMRAFAPLDSSVALACRA